MKQTRRILGILLSLLLVLGTVSVGMGALAADETVLFGERLDVTEHAATNFAYYVVTTNSLGAYATNVLSRPHPIPL